MCPKRSASAIRRLIRNCSASVVSLFLRWSQHGAGIETTNSRTGNEPRNNSSAPCVRVHRGRPSTSCALTNSRRPARDAQDCGDHASRSCRRRLVPRDRARRGRQLGLGAGSRLRTRRSWRGPDFAHYVEGWPRDGDVGVVAEDEHGEPVGAAWYRHLSDDDPGYGFIDPSIPEVTIGVVAPGAARAWDVTSSKRSPPRHHVPVSPRSASVWKRRTRPCGSIGGRGTSSCARSATPRPFGST